MTEDGVEGAKDLRIEFPAPAADAAGVGAHHHPQLVWGRRQPVKKKLGIPGSGPS